MLNKTSDEVTFRPVERALDLGHINEWLVKYGQDKIEYQDLPEIGFVASLEIFIVASAFLRKVEGNRGIFDSLILAPHCPYHLRDLILDGLALRIIEKAKEEKMLGLVGFSHNKRVVDRARKHGFQVLENERIFSLKLEDL